MRPEAKNLISGLSLFFHASLQLLRLISEIPRLFNELLYRLSLFAILNGKYAELSRSQIFSKQDN